MQKLALDFTHTIRQSIALLLENSRVFLQIVDSVLLAYGSEAQKQDPSHGGELEEALLVFLHILEKSRRYGGQRFCRIFTG